MTSKFTSHFLKPSLRFLICVICEICGFVLSSRLIAIHLQKLSPQFLFQNANPSVCRFRSLAASGS
jgi:hypothetical protein